MYSKIVFICFFTLGSLQAQSLLKVKYEAYREVDLEGLTIQGMSIKNTNLSGAFEDAKNNQYHYELLLDKENSSFKLLEKIDNEQGEGGVVVVLNPGGSHLHKNLKEQIYTDEINYLDKAFRVQDTLPDYKWRLINEKKTILDYEVKKAVSTDDSLRVITAWYAPKLAFKDGPRNIWGLPGLILEAEVVIKDEQSTFRAIEIAVVDPLDTKNKIIFPKKGKIISRTAFRALMDEHRNKEREFYNHGVDKD